MRDRRSIARARRGRREQTNAEARLWSAFRDRRFAGIKMRRQHAIGPYVVDFACVALRLVIEVDGRNHAREEQAAFDAQRTAFLENAGWRVARITNADVFAGGDALALKLQAIFRDAATPLPREGERSSERSERG